MITVKSIEINFVICVDRYRVRLFDFDISLLTLHILLLKGKVKLKPTRHSNLHLDLHSYPLTALGHSPTPIDLS